MDDKKQKMAKTLKMIAKDRKRTNVLRDSEQKTIAFFVQLIPAWVSSDGLTAIGFFGNAMVASSFVLASYYSRYWLLLSIIGFMISWFGDSLDGRLAYYRNKPRKWYGFTLDITVDWIGTILIGLGFMLYISGAWKVLGFLFVVMYGWEMITAQLRYKVGGQYSIDSGIFGPTEVRILIAGIMVLETFVPGSIIYMAGIACAILLLSNLQEARRLLIMADQRDKIEKAAKEEEVRMSKKENA